MAIKVRPLTQSDIPAAIDIIQQAFAEDPYFRWVFDEKSVCPSFPLLTFEYRIYSDWAHSAAQKKKKGKKIKK